MNKAVKQQQADNKLLKHAKQERMEEKQRKLFHGRTLEETIQGRHDSHMDDEGGAWDKGRDEPRFLRTADKAIKAYKFKKEHPEMFPKKHWERNDAGNLVYGTGIKRKRIGDLL